MATCWRCHKPVETLASILCPECHVKESAAVHAHDNEPVGGTSCDDSEPCYAELYGGHLPIDERIKMQRGVARNGQRIRKGHHLS